MARRAAPYTIYNDRGTACINARIAGRRIRESLGLPFAGSQRDVARVAADRYASLIAGRNLKPAGRAVSQNTLHEILSMWLGESKKLYPVTIKLFIIHARHFEAHGATFAELVSDLGPQAYATARLARVTRATLRKELSSLWNFFAWCKANGHTDGMPPRPTLPRGALGTRSGKQRTEPVPITPAEAVSIIQALPEFGRKDIIVRDRARFAYETGLRPGTLSRLEVPRHWSPGWTRLHVTADIDKARHDRWVPLTRKAEDVLLRCAPEKGLIFGKHDIRSHLKAAALKVLPKDKALAFAAYDFRHGRILELLEVSGNMPGVAHLVGHKRITTTNQYVRTNEAQAGRVIEMVSNRSGELVRRGGLEPPRVAPLAPQGSGFANSSAFHEPPDTTGDDQNPEEATRLESARSELGQQVCVAALQALMWGPLDAFEYAEEVES